MPPQASAMQVYKFLQDDTSRPLTLQEFTAFWKDLDAETKAQYGREVATLTVTIN